MPRPGDRLRAVLILLLVTSAVLFAVGTTVERNHPAEPTRLPQETSPAEGSSESGHTEETHPAGNEPGTETSEKLFGFDPEAPWVATGVAAAVLLALAVWMVRRRIVLALAIVFGLAVAALDLREMVHQIDVSRASLVAVSIVLAVLHVAIAFIAAALMSMPMKARVTTAELTHM